MNDPKYRFGDTDRLFHRTGLYEIDADEPVMVLRGKDVTALHACMMYVQILLDMPENEVVNSHLDSSIERLASFYRFQTTNVEKSGVGCSQKHHGGSEKIISRARELLIDLKMINRTADEQWLESLKQCARNIGHMPNGKRDAA